VGKSIDCFHFWLPWVNNPRAIGRERCWKPLWLRILI
jgi:hypothetical protein